MWKLYTNVFAIQIKTHMMHHAFSWYFPHATAVPISLTTDKKVLIWNKGDAKSCSQTNAYLCAQGSSGGSKHGSERNK